MDTGFDLVEEIPSTDAQTQLGIEVYLTVKKKVTGQGMYRMVFPVVNLMSWQGEERVFSVQKFLVELGTIG